MRLWLAIRVFFAVLFNARLATRVESLLQELALERQRSPSEPGQTSGPTQAAERLATGPHKTPVLRNDAG